MKITSFIRIILLISFIGGAILPVPFSSPPDSLSASSFLWQNFPASDEELEWLMLEGTYNYHKNTRAKDMKLELPEDFFLGEAPEIKISELPYPKGKNVFCDAAYFPSLLLLLAGREIPNVNFIIIPGWLKNLYLQGGSDKVLFCQYGMVLNRKGELCYGKFEKPISLHSGFICSNRSPQLEEIDFPILNGSLARDLTSDKAKVRELLNQNGISIPKGVFISKENSDEGISAILERFVKEDEISSVVVKPTDGSQGSGVKMFELAVDPFEEAENHIKKLHAKASDVLLEERIISPEWIGPEGEIMDWNIRALVTFDENDNPVIMGLEVRAQPRSNDPVNVSIRASVFELEDVLTKLELSQTKKEEIKAHLNEVILRTSRLLQRETAKLESSSKSAKSVNFLGLDIIFDYRFQAYMMEVNSGQVGGVHSLAKIREGDDKLKAIRPLAKRLAILANRNEQHHLSEPSADKNSKIYLTGSEFNSWLHIGRLYRDKGELDKALKAFLLAIKYFHTETIPHVELGNLYLKIDEHTLAKAEYKKALIIDPNNLGAIKGLAAVCCQLNDFSEIEAEIVEYTEEPDILISIAEIFIDEEERERAENLLQEVASKYPKNKLAWLRFSRLYRKQQKWDIALGFLKIALEIDPKDVSILLRLAYLHRKQRQFDQAEAIFSKAIELEPDNPKAWFQYGSSYYKRGNLDKAEELIKKTLLLDSDFYGALNYMGKILLKRKEPDKAKSFFEKLLALSQNNLNALIGLGRSYLAMKNPIMALEYIERGLQNYPEDKNLQKYLKLARQMKHDEEAGMRLSFNPDEAQLISL